VFRAMLIACFMLVVTPALAEEKYLFETEKMRQDFLELGQELRCPKCQNQNIADSNALISTDMKRKVYELLLQGKSKPEIIQYMKTRYGDFVHYKPPVTPLTLWLYLGPLAFIVAVASFLIMRKRKEGRERNRASVLGKDTQELDSRLRKAEQALKELE